MAKRRKVLEDHKRIGKRYLPTILTLRNLNESNYPRQILPELIWLHLLIRHLGEQQACETIVAFAKHVHEATGFFNFRNFAMASSYCDLPSSDVDAYLAHLRETSASEDFGCALEPLTALYPSFPLSAVGVFAPGRDKEALILEVKEAIVELSDRTERPSMLCQTLAVYIREVCGGLHYVKDRVERPDFDAIFVNPNSDAAHRAAGHVRASMLNEMHPMGKARDDDWPRSFWNHNWSLEECTLFDPEEARRE